MDIEDLYDDDDEVREDKYLLVSVEERGFAIPEALILELIVKPEITSLPDAPNWNPGVITVREEIIPLVELRPKVGLPTRSQESGDLIEILEKSENDHRHWVEELLRCLKADTEFTLSIDHTQCRFGKWYSSFQTDNLQLAMELRKFDRPHRAVHAMAEKAMSIERDQGVTAAVDFVEERKERELRRMLDLFTDTKAILSEQNREIAIILSLARKAALAVDRVDNFATLDVEQATDTSASSLPLGRDPKSNKVYPVLTDEWIDASIKVEVAN